MITYLEFYPCVIYTETGVGHRLNTWCGSHDFRRGEKLTFKENAHITNVYKVLCNFKTI